ncbi:MAG TPA: MBL fold metallo-hydrolase [Candidatus Avisuccinivibrio pullicola]|nr:MBL fold metallo-hydrolase [Candidatus Avisuccinivibrio pullicola]
MHVTLYYLYHSGFALCFDDCTVVCDYFEDSRGQEEGIFHDAILKRPVPLYVLATHFHPDHFSGAIFSFLKEQPDTHYLLSRDIYKRRRNLLPAVASAQIAFLKEGESLDTPYFKVKAFGSTDSGVSFLLQKDGHSFFHAGDLNNWYWSEQDNTHDAKGCAGKTLSFEDAAYCRTMEEKFLTIVHAIKAEAHGLDVVCFPVDPRLGGEFLRGPTQFVGMIPCTYFVPMHFRDLYGTATPFKGIAESTGARFVDIQSRGQAFELDLG